MRKIVKKQFGGIKIALILLLVIIFLGYFYYKNIVMKENFRNYDTYTTKLYKKDQEFKKNKPIIILKKYDSPIPYRFACYKKNKDISICRLLLPDTIKELKVRYSDELYFMNDVNIDIKKINDIVDDNKKLELKDFKKNGIAENIILDFVTYNNYSFNFDNDLIYNNKYGKIDLYDKHKNIKAPKQYINLDNKIITPKSNIKIVDDT
jgi:hypothetical protein